MLSNFLVRLSYTLMFSNLCQRRLIWSYDNSISVLALFTNLSHSQQQVRIVVL